MRKSDVGPWASSHSDARMQKRAMATVCRRGFDQVGRKTSEVPRGF